MPTSACCPRPAWSERGRRRSRFCWHPDCPGCWAWCDCCEAAPAAPGSPVCGPCAVRLARDPPRLRIHAPPAGGKVRESRYGQVERKGRRYRARVGTGGRHAAKILLGYFPTAAEAEAAIAAYRAGRRAA